MENLTYQEYKTVRQKEFDDLPVFFAFSDEQFKEQMEKRGLTANDTDKIYRLGNTGGFYLRSDAPKIRAWFASDDPLEKLMKDPAFAESAFYYEMCNHEYGINTQGSWDVCSCFGHCEYGYDKGGKEYLEEMGFPPETIDAYYAARRRYFKDAKEKEWF